MVKLLPFAASRPVADKVSWVSCRNYDDYSPEELLAWLKVNPYSFLHVLNPAYQDAQKSSFKKRFKGVGKRYRHFVEEGIFTKEEQPAFYLYEIHSRGFVFNGIVCGLSLQDYREGRIKKHEDTLAYRVELFKEYLKYSHLNTEPVLVSYPKNPELEKWITLQKQAVPLYDFSTADRQHHRLWALQQSEQIETLQHFFANTEKVYIADGHHRIASADKLWDEQPEKIQNAEVMSFLISEDNLNINEFNRLILDLNGHSDAQFLELLQAVFNIENQKQTLYKPESKGLFGMYWKGNFYKLSLRAKEQTATDALNQLDAQLLFNQVLQPILGIHDLRNDERIEYLPGTVPLTQIKETVDRGEFELAFMLYPTTVAEIKALADNGQIMPPKTTYIEPKFRSGLLIYEM